MSLIDRLFNSIAECLSPEVAARIASLHVPPDIQSRLDDLACKANSGVLSATERLEYEEYVEGIDFFSILQAKARMVLRR